MSKAQRIRLVLVFLFVVAGLVIIPSGSPPPHLPWAARPKMQQQENEQADKVRTLMFKGAVLSESLNNPTLNDFRKTYVHIEEHPESPEIPFWHLFKVEVADEWM